jgi:hypothetical protein
MLSVLLAPVVSGCGGGSANAPAGNSAAADGRDGVVRPLTQGQLDVAHYASADGLVGFVLDRTGPKPKFRLDGTTDIVELTLEEDRVGGELRGHFLVDPTGMRRLYLSRWGSLSIFTARDQLQVTSDKAASALGAATVKGEPKREVQPYEATVARLTALSVMRRFPEFKSEDAASLEKVEAAVSKATADMFVRYTNAEPSAGGASFEIVPSAFSGVEFGGVGRRSEEKWEPSKAKGLKKFGGELRGFSEYGSRGNHTNVVTLEGYPPPLPSGTPGIVWEVDGLTASFVTLDGVRFQVDLSKGDAPTDKGYGVLAPGTGPRAAWPPPLGFGLLTLQLVSSLGKAGALPARIAEDLLTFDEEWNTCAQKQWKGAERAIDSGRFTEADRKDWVRKVERACAAPVRKQEELLLKVIDGRLRARSNLFQRAAARVAELKAE